MTYADLTNRLARSVDDGLDHILGPAGAEITVVEYGSYACPSCRAANDEIARVRTRFGNRLRYVFRHRPMAGNELARRAAELAERAPDADRFWAAHIKLMSRSAMLTEDDLAAVAGDLRIDAEDALTAEHLMARARQRVDADTESAGASGVRVSPTFFINGRRYDGPWDENSLSDAMLGRLGHRVHSAAVDFASWGPSTGLLLLLATVFAVAISNSPFSPAFDAFFHQQFGIAAGERAFGMPLLHWINDGLLTVFFLVVGLEIKREMTVGRLANRSTAMLPIAGALGGMVVPALIYLAVIPDGPWVRGWGVPMATDTAFAVAIIVMLGRRVPVELRIFLTAAAIVDDIGSIAVLAAFYSGDLQPEYVAVAALLSLLLWSLNRAHVYALSPYLLVGAALWAGVHASGLHATLAGLILALAIPTRPPPNLKALILQADTIITAESHQGEPLRLGPSLPALRALDAIHARIESPADCLLRHAAMRSSYGILPLFALANAGVVVTADIWPGHERLMLAIAAGLFVGKTLGIMAGCALAVGLGLAVKPPAYSWTQLLGASVLAGIGFTMSLFIAGQAFAADADFAAAKVAVFFASIVAAVAGTLILLTAKRP